MSTTQPPQNQIQQSPQINPEEIDQVEVPPPGGFAEIQFATSSSWTRPRRAAAAPAGAAPAGARTHLATYQAAILSARVCCSRISTRSSAVAGT